MYASIGNHLFNLLHYVFAVAFLYFLIPKLIFSFRQDDLSHQLMAYATRSICCLVVIAYMLIMMKLFEVPVLIVLPILVYLNKKNILSLDREKRYKAYLKVVTYYYDSLDGNFSLKAYFQERWSQFWKLQVRGQFQFVQLVETLLLILILVLSFYVRFYDVYLHAAPSSSDAYVALSWMKYARDQMLFVDGIYPQGFYFVLDYLSKFSGIDPVYILRYTGPVMNTLAVYCIYFFVSRISKNRLGGIAAALLFGVFGQILCWVWIRQGATLSQEYGFNLVIPTLYFYYRWVKTKNSVDFYTGLFGSCAVGLIHAIGFVFLWMGVGTLLLADSTLGMRGFGSKFKLTLKAFLISTIMSLAPALMGLLMGKGFHSSSLSFAFEEMIVDKPPITTLDVAALVAIFFLLWASFIGPKERRLGERFIALFGILTFFVYEYLGWITQREVISSRAPDLWAILVPILIGMAVAVLIKGLLRCGIPNPLIALASGITICLLISYYPISVIYPDKLESDSGVEQYLQISQEFMPKSWMIVYSFREANNMIRGKGYHMYVGPKIGRFESPNYFIGRYDPAKEPLTLFDEKKPDINLPGEIFIFYEKEVYKHPVLAQMDSVIGKKQEYATREKDRDELKQWLDDYLQAHGTLPVYYEGQDLTVYHFKRDDSKLKEND
jgi:hypothetical protein